jgi:MYXO-CTERM domain-containing protein
MATLSPLRFHYDSEQFALPIRLGLVSSNGAQDLVVHVLAKGKRYEVANYPNVAAPTNLYVSDATRSQFGAFYAALFDRVMVKNPKAVVTEYAWQAGSCDPCPGPTLDLDTLASLGADVLPSVGEKANPNLASEFVLTRMHARYTKETLGADLVFREGAAIIGGRGMPSGDTPLERGAQSSQSNNFQARYIIRHAWTGPIECKTPNRGIWGGPPGGAPPQPEAAKDLAFAPRGKVQLATFIREDDPDLDVRANAPTQPDPPMGVAVPPAAHTCGCGIAPNAAVASLAVALVPLAAFVLRRRRKVK